MKQVEDFERKDKELTGIEIRRFELYFRYDIAKTNLVGGYDAVKSQVEKDFPGHTFEKMLEQANA